MIIINNIKNHDNSTIAKDGHSGNSSTHLEEDIDLTRNLISNAYPMSLRSDGRQRRGFILSHGQDIL
jgi:hypothetical protein